MSRFFTDYHDAYTAAVLLARQCQHDVAIRTGKEYNRHGQWISLAHHMDSDYAVAEIVKPTDPLCGRVGE